MIELKRTAADDPDFNMLISRLDEDLWRRYPQTQQNYTAHNVIKLEAKVVVAYDDGKPVGCGCFRESDEGTVEIKRMFVLESMRGKGIAKNMLKELETWARGLGKHKAILETGVSQPEAIALYERMGFHKTREFAAFVWEGFSRHS